jgi:hypothetical protein
VLGKQSPSDVQVLNEVQERISQLLPATWIAEPSTKAAGWADLAFDLRGPDGSSGRMVILAKSAVEPKQVPDLVAQMNELVGEPVLAAPFLSKRAREQLEAMNANYIDLAGNALIRLDQPALYIRTTGEDKSPWSTRRTGRTLRGPKAARIVRLLCDTGDSWPNVSQIAEQTNTDAGYVSRVLDVLEREALIERLPRGPIRRVAWEGLIRRWIEDYGVLRTNTYASFLDPRELTRLPGRFERVTLRYALTGSFAASFVSLIAPPRLLMAYVDEPTSIANLLSLKPTTSSPNVILLRPFDPLIYERQVRRDGIRCVAMSQLAADLLTGPGRMPEEGDAILNWMRANESTWRK